MNDLSRPKRILGIEGGGTKTDWVLLGGTGAVLTSGQLPAANLKLISEKDLLALLRVLPNDVTDVGLFLAGCVSPEDAARLRTLASWTWPDAEHIVTGSDRESGIAACLRDDDGIAVISGTGASVTGRKGPLIEKAGGWGHVVGDLGSAYDLARNALSQVLSEYDLRKDLTPFGSMVLRELGLNSLTELAVWTTRASKANVARLAAPVFAAAKGGDNDMLRLIQGGAGILAEFTAAVAERLTLRGPEVFLMGGVFQQHPDYRALFAHRLSILLPGANIQLCHRSGAHGAAWLAMKREVQSEVRRAEARKGPEILSREELALASTESPNPRSHGLDKLSTKDLVDLFVSEEDCVNAALADRRMELIRAVNVVSEMLSGGGRLIYVGAGTSGRLGVLDASEIPPTFGTKPEIVQGIIAGGADALMHASEGAEDSSESGAVAILHRGVTASDVVCGISASGRTPFVLGALQMARRSGAQTIFITCNPNRILHSTPWDVEIDFPTGPELITGSTRLKAGTVTKVALNLISTCAMVRLGRVRGNTMSFVNANNDKLRDRAIRSLAKVTGLPYGEAEMRLEQANWDLAACLDMVMS